MQTKHLWLLPVIILASCSSSHNNANKEAADSTPAYANADSAAAPAALPLTSPQRKIIRTADFTCQVQNALLATRRLETIVKSVGGIVQESHVTNDVTEHRTLAYKADSLKQVQEYTTSASLVLRVPFASLDSVIDAIPQLSTLIDRRELKQSDVTLRYIANAKREALYADNKESSAALALAKKSGEAIDAAKYAQNKKENAIDRQLDNMQLQDDATYATITVTLTQPQQVYTTVIINPQYFTRTPYILQLTTAMAAGWEMIVSLFIALTGLWPLFIMAFAGWYLYRKYFAKKLLPGTPKI